MFWSNDPFTFRPKSIYVFSYIEQVQYGSQNFIPALNFSFVANTIVSFALEWNSTALSLWLQTDVTTYALLDQLTDPATLPKYDGYWAMYTYAEAVPLVALAIYNITEFEYDCNITRAWAKKSSAAGLPLTFLTAPPTSSPPPPPSTTSSACPFNTSCQIVNDTILINSSVSEQNQTVILPSSSQTNVTGDLSLRNVNITVTASNTTIAPLAISGCANFSGVLVLQVKGAGEIITVPLVTTNCVNTYFDRVIRQSLVTSILCRFKSLPSSSLGILLAMLTRRASRGLQMEDSMFCF